mmetsp:Transcript_18959/g.49780  ORF Transcript_18959/g.49780 Transcript_18959/m.49780 type:complete len:238 (+) Transcript_18959:1633-2346(+)
MDRRMGAGCDAGETACMVNNFVGAMQGLLVANGLGWVASNPAAEAEAEAQRLVEAARLAQEAADMAALKLREEAAAAAGAKAAEAKVIREAAAAERVMKQEHIAREEAKLAETRKKEREEREAREAKSREKEEAKAREEAERAAQEKAIAEADKEAAVARSLKDKMKRAMMEARSDKTPKEGAFVKVQNDGGWSFGENVDPYANGRPSYEEESEKYFIAADDAKRRRTLKSVTPLPS